MIQPLYLGLPGRRLYGVYHAPSRDCRQDAGVVLCGAIGQESMRSHRALYVLAMMTAQAGFPTLRFDYHATGDSPGTATEGRCERWIGDISAAVEELGGRTGLEIVHLIGLRLGASLAALASRDMSSVSGLVLWEPVIDGRQYLRELRTAHAAWLAGSFASADADSGAEILGFPLTSDLERDLEGINLQQQWSPPPGMRWLLLTADDTPRVEAWWRCGRTEDAVGSAVARVHTMQGERIWEKAKDDLGQALVPRATLQEIVHWLMQGDIKA